MRFYLRHLSLFIDTHLFPIIGISFTDCLLYICYCTHRSSDVIPMPFNEMDWIHAYSLRARGVKMHFYLSVIMWLHIACIIIHETSKRFWNKPFFLSHVYANNLVGQDKMLLSPHWGNRRWCTVGKSAWLWLASVAREFSWSPHTPPRTQCSPGWTRTLKRRWRQHVRLEVEQKKRGGGVLHCYLDDKFRVYWYHYLSRSALPYNFISSQWTLLLSI